MLPGGEVYAINRVMGACAVELRRGLVRGGRELLSPADYFRMS